jgi:hypothetical protein
MAIKWQPISMSINVRNDQIKDALHLYSLSVVAGTCVPLQAESIFHKRLNSF